MVGGLVKRKRQIFREAMRRHVLRAGTQLEDGNNFREGAMASPLPDEGQILEVMF